MFAREQALEFGRLEAGLTTGQYLGVGPGVTRHLLGDGALAPAKLDLARAGPRALVRGAARHGCDGAETLTCLTPHY